MNIKFRYKETITVIISLLFAIVLTELIARFIYKNSDKKTDRLTKKEFLLKYNQVHSNTNIYSEKFFEEQINFPIMKYDFKKKIWKLIDQKSENFNTKKGKRFTSFANSNPKNYIHVFGGSTIFNEEVPDEYTVTSYLQSFVNSLEKNFNVINHGIMSDMTHTQNIRLRETKLNKNDIVVFYSGPNDIGFILQRNNKSGINEDWIEGHAVKTNVYQYNIFEKFAITLHNTFLKRYFFKILNENITSKKINDVYMSDEILYSNIEFLQKNYLNQINMAKNYSDEKEVYFFNLLHPNLYSKKINNLTKIEKLIIQNEQLTRANPKKYYDLGFPLLKRMINQRNLKVYSYDLTNIFDNNKKEIFVGDAIHVNHAGNKIVAEAIFEIIRTKIN